MFQDSTNLFETVFRIFIKLKNSNFDMLYKLRNIKGYFQNCSPVSPSKLSSSYEGLGPSKLKMMVIRMQLMALSPVAMPHNSLPKYLRNAVGR